jgi:hypothetical protein
VGHASKVSSSPDDVDLQHSMLGSIKHCMHLSFESILVMRFVQKKVGLPESTSEMTNVSFDASAPTHAVNTWLCSMMFLITFVVPEKCSLHLTVIVINYCYQQALLHITQAMEHINRSHCFHASTASGVINNMLMVWWLGVFVFMKHTSATELL